MKDLDYYLITDFNCLNAEIDIAIAFDELAVTFLDLFNSKYQDFWSDEKIKLYQDILKKKMLVLIYKIKDKSLIENLQLAILLMEEKKWQYN